MTDGKKVHGFKILIRVLVSSVITRNKQWSYIKMKRETLRILQTWSRKWEGLKMQQKSWTGRRRSITTDTCQADKTGYFTHRLFLYWRHCKIFEKFRLRTDVSCFQTVVNLLATRSLPIVYIPTYAAIFTLKIQTGIRCYRLSVSAGTQLQYADCVFKLALQTGQC